MLHGTKSSRFRNGRGPSTSQSGNAILAKARKEREQRENQKLQVAACTIIQSKIRLALCRRKTYAEFLNGNLIPGLYTSLCKNKSIPVFPIRRSDLWFVKLEIQSKFAVLKKMTEDSTMSPEFFFLLVGSALKSYVSLMSQECFIDLINILLDGVENNAGDFYRVLDSSFLQDESSTDLQEDSDLYLNNPGLIYFRAYDASLGDLLNYVGNSTSGKVLIKRLLKTLITPAYVLYTLFVSTKLTQYIYEEDAYELMTPTEEQLSQIKEFPVSKLTLYRSVDMGIFQPFILCFKNCTPVYSFLVDHIIETSTLRQLHLHAIQCNFVKFPNCPAEYSFKAHYKQLGIFFLSVVKLKHNDPVYMWILYGLYHMYDYHIGPFPSQYLANPVFEITNCNKVFNTLNKVVEWSTSTKSYFEMTYCYFYLKTCYEGHIALEEILNGPSQILEVEPNEINLKALAYIYARIPYDNELALKIKFNFEFDSELNDVFMSFEDTSVEQASAHWGRNLQDYRAELIKVFGVQQLGPGLQIDRENMNTSMIKAMMAINHNQFNVRYKGEEGRGDGLKKQFLTDSMKLFFMKSKMFDIDYEKAKLWPSKMFFDTPVGELFEDDSVQHLHHKSLIELAGKCLGLMMLENYLCPFVFSKAFLMKFTARLLLKHEQVKELDFDKSQIDFLNFADLEVEDQSLHEQLLTLTKLTSEELEAMDLFMEYKDCNFGVSHGMPVNKNNLHFYIDNIVNYELNDSKTETFVEHFTAGFVKMIPPHVTSQLLALSFNRCKFLSTVISGEGKQAFPVEEFLESLTYQGYHWWDQRIRTLGEILKYEMDDRDRWAFFEFVTGMAMIPITGIKNMEPKVCIAKMPNYTNDMIAYPTASTCVNMLVLPDYEDRDEMIERLAYVVSSDHEFHRE